MIKLIVITGVYSSSKWRNKWYHNLFKNDQYLILDESNGLAFALTHEGQRWNNDMLFEYKND